MVAKLKSSFLDYPIYAIGSDGEFVLTSGGGGGKDYGIEDQLEQHKFNPDDSSLGPVTATAAAGGVVDSIVYSAHANLWAGCVRNKCILFRLDRETGPRFLHSFGIEAKDVPKPPRLVVVRFSPSGELLITGGDDKQLRIWRLHVPNQPRDSRSDEEELWKNAEQPVELVANLSGHTGEVKDCYISPDSQLVATCASDDTFRIWDVKNGKLLHTQEKANPNSPTNKLTFRCCRFLRNPPGTTSKSQRLLTLGCGLRGPSYAIGWAVTVGADDSIKCDELKTKWIDNTPCCQLALSSDDHLFAVGFASGKCKVFDRGINLVNEHATHDLPVTGVCFLDKSVCVPPSLQSRHVLI
eukprot:GHVT01003004.1.p1 GENE.GHVT01003004.1~~GHVT01003004.1.p1  ORF type:complete len:353 (+),score=21.36 GHVT01003004.1:217-1275(+)